MTLDPVSKESFGPIWVLGPGLHPRDSGVCLRFETRSRLHLGPKSVI